MKKKILLIDDDKELSGEMVDLLQDEGYDVKVAFDGAQGERFIKKSCYDIILLDFKMPKLNGIEVLQRVKSLKSKVILISGRPFIEKEIKENNLSHMVRGCIHKPYNVQELLHLISK
jgi:DNA-binding response OmpR family regulator